jgi:hypothetical protein
MPESHPTEFSIEDIKIAIRTSRNNANVGRTHQIVLKEGPKVYRVATIFEILNAATGEFHHFTLRIDSYERTRSGYQEKLDRCVTIPGNDSGELVKLLTFIQGVVEQRFPDKDGIFHVVDATTYSSIEELLHLVQQATTDDKRQLLQTILADVAAAPTVPQELIGAFASGSGEFLRSVAIATRLIEYRRTYEQLRQLVANPTTSESALQNLLAENPWLFGSEYSELLERRAWTRDDRLDFMLRRTVDGYLEIIEIKTPFTEPLLRHDSSHDSYFPSSKLAAVIGQVVRYIEEIERQRDSIVAKDACDPLKIRARIIIGRDGDRNHQKALHNLNAHLHRIEVITFDQLLRIGERVLSVFQDEVDSTNGSDSFADEDIPF